LPETSPFKTLEASQLFEEYRQILEQIITDSQAKTGVSLTGDIGSLIAGEVLTVIAIRLGISAGILGAGAGSSWATFGIGLAVAVIIDWIVSKIWDWYADPKGELAKKIDEELDTLRDMIIDELRQQLLDYSGARSALREKAIRELLRPCP
jgi:hypothetical protein